jgi:hypothetical protein
VERSETLGISYQLRSALKLKERHRLPAKKRASVVVPFCKRVMARGYPSHLPVVALWSVPQIYRRDCIAMNENAEPLRQLGQQFHKMAAVCRGAKDRPAFDSAIDDMIPPILQSNA